MNRNFQPTERHARRMVLTKQFTLNKILEDVTTQKHEYKFMTEATKKLCYCLWKNSKPESLSHRSFLLTGCARVESECNITSGIYIVLQSRSISTHAQYYIKESKLPFHSSSGKFPGVSLRYDLRDSRLFLVLRFLSENLSISLSSFSEKITSTEQ
jgi:hypothetical protein